MNCDIQSIILSYLYDFIECIELANLWLINKQIKHANQREINKGFIYIFNYDIYYTNWEEIATCLLKHGANINAVIGDNDLTALFNASGHPMLEQIEFLLKNGAKCKLNDEIEDALYFAVIHNYHDNFKLLLNYGAIPTEHHLILACCESDANIVKQILNYDDIDIESKSTYYEHTYYYYGYHDLDEIMCRFGDTPLLIAVKKTDQELTDILIKKGANITSKIKELAYISQITLLT